MDKIPPIIEKFYNMSRYLKRISAAGPDLDTSKLLND